MASGFAVRDSRSVRDGIKVNRHDDEGSDNEELQEERVEQGSDVDGPFLIYLAHVRTASSFLLGLHPCLAKMPGAENGNLQESRTRTSVANKEVPTETPSIFVRYKAKCSPGSLWNEFCAKYKIMFYGNYLLYHIDRRAPCAILGSRMVQRSSHALVES